MLSATSLPDDNQHINIRGCVLDPLSVIVKLAILGNKPVGTKVCIQNNVMHFQEPGPFQSVCRYMYQSNKTDLQYMYNPIHLACVAFLKKNLNDASSSNASSKKGMNGEEKRMRNLFLSAQKGIERLIETYKQSSIIRLCLNYYHVLITNYVDEIYQDAIFRKDGMTQLYTDTIVGELNRQWNPERLKIVLDLIGFLNGDSMAASNVKSLETIMHTIDEQTYNILKI
jgi:hypothetical protein